MKKEPCFSTSEEDENDDECSGSTRWWRSDPNSSSFSSSAGLSPRERVLRELERLFAAVRDHNGLSELRHKLFTYRCGDFWVPTGGIPKESTEIPPIATILLLGFSGAGKSSLVNLMYSVLGRSCLIPFAQTSNSGGSHSNNTSMFLEEHNVIRSLRNGFCVYDSRGFDYGQASEVVDVELSDWINDGVHHNQLCLRAGDQHSLPGDELEALSARSSSSSKFVRRRVNCAMVVVNAAEVYSAIKVENHKPLDAVKELYRSAAFKKWTENPMLILTHGDELSREERMEARLMICEWVGLSETSGVYDVVCQTEHGFAPEDSDPISAYSVAEAVYRALVMSDRTHPPKRNCLDWLLLVLSWIMCFFAAVFAFLAEIFAKLGHRDGRLRL